MTILKVPPVSPLWCPDKPAALAAECDQHTPTLEQCALNALAAVAEHTDAARTGELEREFVSDLITDLLHLCERHGWRGDEVCSSAIQHWRQERSLR